MCPKPDVSEERTEQILNAALEVFSKHGFDKARMQDVGKRAGISKATVYLYFESKEALIGAMVKQLFDRELAALDVLEDNEESARQSLTRFVEVLVEDVVRMRSLMLLLYEVYAGSAGENRTPGSGRVLHRRRAPDCHHPGRANRGHASAAGLRPGAGSVGDPVAARIRSDPLRYVPQSLIRELPSR